MNTTTLLQSLAAWVLWNSSGAAVLVLLILAVRLVAGRAMSARLRSRLWLLVVVRLMVPMLPAVSLPNRMVAGASSLMPRTYSTPITHETMPAAPAERIERTRGRSDQAQIDNAPQFVVVEEGMVPASATPTPIPMSAPIVSAEARPALPPASVNWRKILLVTWLAGAVVLLGRLVISTFRLTRSTRRLDLITDPKIVELLASCGDLFGLARSPQLLAGGEGSAPALIGVIHPKILLPASLASQLTLDEIRLIFLHELAHLRRRDVLLNYLFAILIALHWFNPLVWIASYRMAADRELACDEAVLRVTSRRHARMYGCTILKLVELLNVQRLPAGAVGVVQNKILIQRRIDMIASYPSRSARSSLLVRIAAVSLAIAAGVSAIRAQSLPVAPPAPESTTPRALPPAAPTPAGTPANPAEPSALPVPAGAPTPAAQPPGAENSAPATPSALPLASDPKASPGEAVPPPAAGIAPLPRGPYIVDPLAPGAQPALTPPRLLRGGGFSGMGGGRAMSGYAPPHAGNMITPTVEDAASRQANAEVLQKLTVARGADFNSLNLRDALSYIADEGGVEIVIDERALSEAGVDMVQTPVTMRVKSKPIEQVLSLTLRLAGPQLDYSIYNGVVFVSSREALNRRIVTRIYDLPSSVDRDAMLQMISTAVGGAQCNFFEQKIVVTAPEVAQRDIARLLAQIEPPAPRAKATGGFFLFHLHNTKATEVAAKFPKELGSAAADERTNSVLITTTQADQAKDFVVKLDTPAKSNGGNKEDAEVQLDRYKADLDASRAHEPAEKTAADSAVQILEEARTSMQSVYGSDSPKVKQLEQQLAEARIRAIAANARQESASPQQLAIPSAIAR